MYILIVARGYPTDRYKMNGIFEFDQARALAQAGHKVIYAAVDVRSLRRWRKWGIESLVKDGVLIEAINIPCGRVPKQLLNRARVFGLNRLYRHIKGKHGQPDIIHSHFIGSGYMAVKVFSNLGIPLILTEHYSAMNQKQLDTYYHKVGKYTYPRVSKVVAVSDYLAKNINSKFNVDVCVIPNIVDTSCFGVKSKNSDSDGFSFISTGNLQPNKRMDLLIDSFYAAFKDNNDVRLHIFGEGPERKKLEKMIADYNLRDRVFLMGLAERKDIAVKMQESDCFVLASRLETFGVAYIEALAAGLPVIATRCGGPEDFINKKNGILVDVDDNDALVAAMLKMYMESNKFDRVKISTDVKNKFSPVVVARKLTDVYNEILK